MRACKAQCCKRGYLPVSEKEAELFGTTEGLINLTPPCMHLDNNNACSVYEKRPKACREFPLYEKGKTLLVASWCPGYQEGLLDEFLKLLEGKGYQILVI
ncbi:MAG: YkgJ family cysteine cluster protein [Nanoarchaeota archaeon]|nr:YkgJ family cysteine cluster protein [Nanoarchaeota archaeon]